MDLYKVAYWFAPLVSSDLILDGFELAAQARELDMRASPYDMTPFGLEPIRVETPDGRREFTAAQSRLLAAAEPLRRRLLASLAALKAPEPQDLP